MSSYVNAKGISLSLSQASSRWIANTAGAESQIGTIANEVFQGAGGDRLAGGGGDDAYYLWDGASTVVEKAGEGIDTIYANYWGAVTLPDNVENLFLQSGGSTSGTGNALNNIIVAGSVGATLDGRGGDDVLVGGAGADLFKVAAGNGSDTIMNFKSSFDVIQLQGYGITSFDQLKALGSQVGADVLFKFGNGESLVVRDVTLSSLTAYDFGLRPAATAVLAGEAHMGGPAQFYTSHGFGVLNNIWNPGTLVAGKDYFIDSTFNKSDVTAHTTFDWSFPVVTDLYSPIRAYPEIMLGYSPFDATKYAPKSEGFNPTQVSNLSKLVLDYDVSFKGNVAGFNVAFDIFLTNKLGGDASTITNELMIWVHNGGSAPYGQVVAAYADGGITGSIYLQKTGSSNYIALVLDQDHPTGSIDVTHILAKLQTMGIVASTEYVSSIQLGSEVTSGSGSLTINNLDVTAQTHNANGTDTVTTITGTGTSSTILAPVAKPVDLSGDNLIVYDPTAKIVDGGAGNDTLILKIGATVELGNLHYQVTGATADVLGFENVDASAATAGVTVHGSAVNSVLTGSAFADTLTGGVSSDVIHGGNGADYIDGGSGSDRLYGDDGNDRIVYDAADALIDGGAGRDTLLLKAGATVDLNQFSSSQVSGGAAYVTGFEDADASGASSAVTMTASQFGSTLTGSAFADTLRGGAAADILNGGDGADYLDGGAGADRLSGGAGDDRIVYDAADYVIDGGAGTDTLILKSAATVNLGNFSSSQVAGGTAYVSGFENVDASGASAGVVLNGSQYNNVLVGSAFADVISGGGGNDILTGGGGADTFKFTPFTPGQTTTITDFSSAQGDRIDLSMIDAIAGGKDDPFSFIGSGNFHHVAGELRFGATNGGVTVQGDVDGNGVADFSIFVAGNTTLVQHDFVL